MYTPISNTLHRINYKPKKLNILTFCTHEGYQTMLAKTGHNFYMLTGNNMKAWDYQTKPIPPNHYLCQPNHLPDGVQFDLIFSQSRFGQLQNALELKRRLDLPICHVDHTEILPNLAPNQVQELIGLKADKHVFITEHNRRTWQGNLDSVVIKHGIDLDIFQGWNGAGDHGISVVNQFANRDVFCGWELFKIIASKLKIQLVGDNPGISESAKSTEDLVHKLATARYFLNTSQLSPIPLSLLEAMAVGCPILSTAKQEIPKVITHGVNGLLYDTPEEAIMYAQKLIKEPEYAATLGAAARKTIEEKYNIGRFVQEWNKVFLATVEENR